MVVTRRHCSEGPGSAFYRQRRWIIFSGQQKGRRKGALEAIGEEEMVDATTFIRWVRAWWRHDTVWVEAANSVCARRWAVWQNAKDKLERES
ncbi:hypothetical protein NDU88_011559 [Pleurodeles waltl]|uniref:Uncharacterized protein n=1 Tax=Pleurodeles waltl TaxID=8319 RepID=A0AAV7QYY1_PLEWA|nr:hypothetical protein NDU88_011559 [Pleurodeles waltl]